MYLFVVVTIVTYSVLVVILDSKDTGIFTNYEVINNGNDATVKN